MKGVLSLLKNGEVARKINGVAAGTGTTNGSSVDMQGYESAMFILAIGAIDATGTVDLKVQGSSDDGSADAFADLTGTKVSYTATDDNKLAIVEVVNPVERYLRPVVVRSTANSVIDGCVSVLFGARKAPTTQGSTIVANELHIGPAEGTA